jgi:hypothetical protein
MIGPKLLYGKPLGFWAVGAPDTTCPKEGWTGSFCTPRRVKPRLVLLTVQHVSVGFIGNREEDGGLGLVGAWPTTAPQPFSCKKSSGWNDPEHCQLV